MTLHDRLEEVLRTFFNDDELVLTPETVPADVPGWDSLAQVNVVFAIEEAFGIQLGDEQISRFSSIAELEAQIAARLESRGGQWKAASS
jgi:acyl carrier protein